MLLLLLLLTTPFLAIAAPVPYKNCGTDKDHVKIVSVDVTPWPPVPTKDVTGAITATLDEVVSAATVEVRVKLYGAEVYHQTVDACHETPEVTCPIQPGTFNFKKTMTLPKVPHGSYEFYAKGKDQKGEELFCFILPLTIKAQPAIDQDIIDTVNNLHTTWTAGYNAKFATATRDQAQQLCGVLEGGPVLPEKENLHAVFAPDSYDVREAWGTVCPSVKELWDQGPCGSCWAFGGVTAMTDRVCMATQGKTKIHVSGADPVACCSSCGYGCQGGYPSALWSYWKGTGIVTGGSKESKEGCLPYFFDKCDHHTTGKYPPCPSTQPTPSCTQQCQSGYPYSWASDKHFGASAYSVRGEDAMKQEIYSNGPIEVAFTVYEDFLAYKTGVYHHVTGGYLGGHAVAMYGYGTLDGTPYWIVKNSWNEDWGDGGYFLILRGKNECGIESGAVAGMPKM